MKVRLQSQPEKPPFRYAGPIDCFRQSFREEGVRGLYRGISAPLFGAAIETSSLFFSYRVAQKLLRSALPQSEHGSTLTLPALIACGAASGAFTSLILTPIELIKCQMQVPLSVSNLPHNPPPRPLAIITTVFRHHGIIGFWHGQLATLIRETGGSAAWFGVYEGVSSFFRTRNNKELPPSSHRNSQQLQPLPVWQQLISGASAGVSYILGFFPADTIKSRMQTAAVIALPGSEQRRTFWGSGISLWREQGVRGLYRGCGITTARAAPSSAFMFTIYEGLRGAYGG